MEFESKFLGINKRMSDSYMLDFKITINKVDFEYSMGLGHLKTKIDRVRPSDQGLTPLRIYELDDEIKKEIVKSLNRKDIRQVFELPNMLYYESPKSADVMECLESDASCGEMLFKDFCDGLGYDTDSRKALEIYESCQYTAIKLRQVRRNEK